MTKQVKRAVVYRFYDAVAVATFQGNNFQGQSIYLSKQMAEELAQALMQLVVDIDRVRPAQSNAPTIKLAERDNNLILRRSPNTKCPPSHNPLSCNDLRHAP